MACALALLASLVACGGPDATPPAAAPTSDADPVDAADAEVGGDADAEDAPLDTPDDADEGAPDVADLDVDAGVEDSAEDAPLDDADTNALPDFTREDHCGEVEGFRPVFPNEVAAWARQDDASPPPAGALLLVGSSSARRWEGFARAYTDYEPLQRGFGGAQLGEVALQAEALIVRHDPRAVLIYAGTNDLAVGVGPDVVIERFRCLRQRIGLGLGWDRPVIFIGIAPTPARWSQRDAAEAVNAGVRALEAIDPALHYIDLSAAFLATGAPPDASLFVSDGLHLSPAGYALWERTIRPEIERVLPPWTPTPATPLPVGTRLLIDLGPDNDGEGGDGERTPSPDYLGQRWNNWHSLPGDGQVLPGEHLDDLQTDAGDPTPIDLVVTGGFAVNGWANGGWRWPEQDRLGALAVGSATGDFFYTTGDDITGGLLLRGLNPDQRYTLRLFASRDDPQPRTTRYTATGASSATTTLQTSGPGAGSDGSNRNDDDTAELRGVQPDAWGHVFIDVSIEEGSYGYLSLIELQVE